MVLTILLLGIQPLELHGGQNMIKSLLRHFYENAIGFNELCEHVATVGATTVTTKS